MDTLIRNMAQPLNLLVILQAILIQTMQASRKPCKFKEYEISFCSQIVRKKRNQQPSINRKLLIFSVDQPGLEPGTSRL